MRDALLQAILHNTHRTSRHTEPAINERAVGDFQSLSFPAKQIIFWHKAVVIVDLSILDGEQTHLVFHFFSPEARRVVLDNECRDLAIIRVLCIGGQDVCKRAISDPMLFPFQYIMVAFGFECRSHRRWVASGGRFCQRKCHYALATRCVWQVLFLLFFASSPLQNKLPY